MRLSVRNSYHSVKSAKRRTPVTPQILTSADIKTNTQKIIANWVWAVFIASILLFLATLFVGSWTSTGPTFLPSEQQNLPVQHLLPPLLQVPQDVWQLLLPPVLVISACILIRYLPSNTATRFAVRAVLLMLMVRYLAWRTLDTLNFSTSFSTALSLSVYAIELFGCFTLVLNALQTIWSTDPLRSRQADRYAQDILSGRYVPSVDVFVPTYNEPEFIVQRTVLGCKAMEYPNMTIYILDDGQRPHMQAMAERLGCQYVTRTHDNHSAKAGNLNNALPQTQGELITIMDSDFVPFKNFLLRTVGFFQDPKVALIQTPQHFYNPDHHIRNLGVDHAIPYDLDSFFGFGESTRDAGGSAMCCGTSYVVRRSALEEIGGYFTRCLAEDSPTSTLMLTHGYKILYLNEVLSMGESTRNYREFLKQRLRWLQSNLQTFYCTDDIPIWSKLNFVQKSYALMHLLGCFNSFFRAAFLLLPLISIYLGVSPLSSSAAASVYFMAPYLLFMAGTHAWSMQYTSSFFWNEVYDVMQCFPSLGRVMFTLQAPFKRAVFHVTTKGETTNRKQYNFVYTWPLIVLIVLSLIAIALHVGGSWAGSWNTMREEGFSVMFFWLIYNLVIMSIAVIAAVDQPERRILDRFPLRAICTLKSGEQIYWGYTEDFSESGARLVLGANRLLIDDGPLTLELPEYGLSLEAELCRATWPDPLDVRLGVKFIHLTLEQNQKLVEALYTNPNWWKARKRPGTLDTLFELLSSFIQLKPLRNRYS